MSAPPPAPADDPHVLVVTTMKNEGPFILEWIAFHRAVGVSDFLVYTNDCDDGTVELLDRLAELGGVTRRDNPYDPSGKIRPQHAALRDATETDAFARADWALPMDVDEYLNIHAGEGRFSDLFAATGPADLVSFTWRLFGNDDAAGFEDRFVTEQFTACAPEECRKPHQAWGFKTAVRLPMPFEKLGVHRPVKPGPGAQGVRWLNGSGEVMPGSYLRNGWRSNRHSIGYRLATLNHYAVRSADSFLVKRARGRVNHTERDQGLGYWFIMNHNAERDERILARLPAARAELAAMLKDSTLEALHRASVAAHRRRIDVLMQDPEARALHRQITGAQMRTLSRNLAQFSGKQFEAGPPSVPDEEEPRDPSRADPIRAAPTRQDTEIRR